MVRHREWLSFGLGLLSVSLLVVNPLSGQVPIPPAGPVAAPPPQKLPNTITGTPTAPAPVTTPVAAPAPVPTPAVRPVVGNQVQAPAQPAPPTAGQPPIARFLTDLRSFPPETELAVYSMRAGADWLWRMNQTSGRFLPGLNPAIRQWLEMDNDLRQAFAVYALAEAAKMTGDERFAARANGTVLALLALTKPDATDPLCRVPVATSDRCHRVCFASVLALAIYHLPSPDAKQLADADALCNYVRKQCRADGSIVDSTEQPKVDGEGAAIAPGMALQALLLNYRVKPEPAKRDAIVKAITYYRAAVKAKPQPIQVAALIPALVDFCLQNNKDAATATSVFELTDWLATCQYPRTDSRNPQWIGGFKDSPTATNEPNFETGLCVMAMCHAAKLTRQMPDLARFYKYRVAAVEGLNFLRTMQYTDESANHFEKAFRTNFLNGAVRMNPNSGIIRIDATAEIVLAELAFLQCGTENRID